MDQSLMTSQSVDPPMDQEPKVGDIWTGTIHSNHRRFVILQRLKQDWLGVTYRAYVIDWLEMRDNSYWHKSCEGHVSFDVSSRQLSEKLGTVTPDILRYLLGRHR